MYPQYVDSMRGSPSRHHPVMNYYGSKDGMHYGGMPPVPRPPYKPEMMYGGGAHPSAPGGWNPQMMMHQPYAAAMGKAPMQKNDFQFTGQVKSMPCIFYFF